MKQHLRLLISVMALMCFTLGVNAQLEGKYYFRNVGAGLYLGASNNWGTQASLVSEQQYGILACLEDGIYTLETMVSNGGNNYYFSGSYMDGTPIHLTIKQLRNGYYTMANPDGAFYGYDGNSTVLATSNSAESENFQWQLLTEDEMATERAEAISAASADNPVDVTWLIADAYFGRNRRDVSAWTMEANNKNLNGGGSNGGCAESYHSTFSLSQVIANAPKGVYKLSASAFYRQDGADEEHLPYIYLSDGTNTVASPFELRTGSENSMNDAAGAFNNGLYKLEPVVFQLAEEGDMTVGAKLEDNTNLWCIWGRFTLTYLGPDADITESLLKELIAKVEELRAKAKELKAAVGVPSEVVAAIEEALNGSADIEANEDAYNAAIEALQIAVGKAQIYVNAKAYFDKMASVLNNTNVYTQEAYDAVYGTWLAEYNAGTLSQETAAMLNAAKAFSDGWHAANNIDDVLLSAWTIGGEQAYEYDKALYINTWSVEGDNDGSNFKAPFFEYWTSDANSLGANTITATLEGIAPGDYVVKAWVRARAKNGTSAAEATGITLSANGGEAVDVTAGKAVGTSQFNIGEYTVNATVGEDGILTITFDIDEDNNVSWISFKDVKYLTSEEFAQEEQDKNLVYASDFDKELTNGVPTGWVTYNDAGYHIYGFNEDGEQYTYHYGGNPGGGGTRLFDGFSGDFTKALYWGTRGTNEGYIEFGSLVKDYLYEDGTLDPTTPEGIGLKLEPGDYHLSVIMPAWKGEPTFTTTILDLDYNVCASFDELLASPNVGGSIIQVDNAPEYTMNFSIDKEGYYILRFTAAEALWMEYLLASVKIYKGKGGHQNDDQPERVYATFENPSNTNTTWDAATRTFTWSTTYYNQLRNIGLPSGDITKYKKLVVDCTINSGEQFRILFYKGGSNLTLFAENGINEFYLEEALAEVAPNNYMEYLLNCDEICISGNNGAAPGEAIINAIYLEAYPEEDIMSGDANSDNIVDIVDVTATVNYILGNPSENFNRRAADVNGDKTVDVVDVVAIVNIILRNGAAGAKSRNLEALSNALMMMGDKDGMSVLVEAADKFAALQFDVVTDNATLQKAILNSSSEHQIGFAKVADNRYRVVAFSMNNDSFQPTADALVKLVLSDGTAQIENATFVSADGRSMTMDIAGDATAIAGIATGNQADVIYNLAGQRMSKNAQSLPAGIYIRNGKKFQVK